MPTTPIASAIGMRSTASSIIASRPIKDSVIASGGSGGGLRHGAVARDEYLVDVNQARERDHRVHEIHEWPDGDAQHVGGVAVAVDPAGLDPDLPGEEKHDRGADRVGDADPD